MLPQRIELCHGRGTIGVVKQQPLAARQPGARLVGGPLSSVFFVPQQSKPRQGGLPFRHHAGGGVRTAVIDDDDFYLPLGGWAPVGQTV
jgi:hypothetical protein